MNNDDIWQNWRRFCLPTNDTSDKLLTHCGIDPGAGEKSAIALVKIKQNGEVMVLETTLNQQETTHDAK